MSTPETQKALALARQMRLLPFKHGQDVATTIEALAKRVQELEAQAAAMRSALEEVAKQEGGYNRHPFRNASNTIEDMVAIAQAALVTDAGKELLARVDELESAQAVGPYEGDRAEAAANLWESLAEFEGEDADAQRIIDLALFEYAKALEADKSIVDWLESGLCSGNSVALIANLDSGDNLRAACLAAMKGTP